MTGPVERRTIRVPPLPEARLRELAGEGLSTIRIAVELESEGCRCQAHHVREALRALGLLSLDKRGPTPLGWTAEMDARLCEAFASGLSAEAAGARLGVGGTLARKRADALGIPRRRAAPPPPGPVRARAVAMILDGASYNEASRETGASPGVIGRWAKAAGVVYAPRECPHAACARRRWADPAQRERFAEVGRRLMADPAHKAAMAAGARVPEARRATWEARNPHLVHLTPEELGEYRFLCDTKRLKRDEALAVIADAAVRVQRKAA